MIRKIAPVLVVIVLAVAGFTAWKLLPGREASPALLGYVEGRALYLASPVAGSVTQLAVRRGQRVEAGDALFVIDPDQLAAQAAGSAADLAAAQAQAQDARKGERAAELAVLQAALDAAEATARNAAQTLARTQTLTERGVYAQARLDADRAAFDAAQASAEAARRRLDAARLAARPDQIAAADARVRQAEAGLAAASARLADLSPGAPGPALVEDVFLQPGEWAAANQPVLALLPDDQLFIRFFVPETQVALYRPGQQISYRCDGCASNLTATIAYVSPRPEFTPPVIYSRESRDRLVYLVEAAPSSPRALAPGLPVEVESLGGAGQ